MKIKDVLASKSQEVLTIKRSKTTHVGDTNAGWAQHRRLTGFG